MKVVIIGGGISGLAAAHRLARAGHEAVCLEAAGRPGGLIHSERREGFLCESGPQAVLDGAPETRALIEEAGLADRLVRASAAARRRFIYIRGALRAVPTGPFGLIRGDILSVAGKARLLREPFIERRVLEPGEDESVLELGRRRLGSEAATALLAPAVIGVYAGDAARLSARSALPRVHELEQRWGSLARGVLRSRRAGGGTGIGRMASFPNGLEELPAALARALGHRYRHAEAAAVSPGPGGTGWRIDLADGSVLEADRVAIAASPGASARLIEPLAPEAARALRAVPLAPVAVACLGFRGPPAALGMDLEAYGFLVARGERPTILGCQYETSVFPDRAPAGTVLLRVIAGGTFDPGLVEQDEKVIADRAVSDLRIAAGLRAEPDFVAVFRNAAAIPQYELGHAARVAAVDADLGRHPGLHLLSHALRGVGVNDCIQAAADLAASLGRKELG